MQGGGYGDSSYPMCGSECDVDFDVFQCALKYCLPSAHYRERSNGIASLGSRFMRYTPYFIFLAGALEEHQLTYDAQEGGGESSSERATGRGVSGINQS